MKRVSGGSDHISSIQYLKCCEFIGINGETVVLGSQLNENNWSHILDNNNKWATVGNNRFMIGFYRSGENANINNIEYAHSRYAYVLS